ncbi:MAG: SH3 domain-containing protein [Methyloligellaceae bacterium]
MTYLMKLSTFVLVAVAAAFGITGPAHAVADGPDFYQVRSVSYSDVLNIRKWPSHRSRIIGVIPPNGKRVRNLVRRVDGWCLVRYRRVEGWAKCRYLAEQGDRFPDTYKVHRVAGNDVLYVRRWPSHRSRIVNAIPPRGRNVYLIRTKGNWGKVIHRGKSGWVNLSYLRPQY